MQYKGISKGDEVYIFDRRTGKDIVARVIDLYPATGEIQIALPLGGTPFVRAEDVRKKEMSNV